MAQLKFGASIAAITCDALVLSVRDRYVDWVLFHWIKMYRFQDMIKPIK